MTLCLKSFKLNTMKWTIFFLILSLLFGFQQRSIFVSVAQSQSEGAHNHHEEMSASFLEALEIFLTGSLTHTHEHDESEGDSHEHSHAHQLNGAIASHVCILVRVQFSFSSVKQVWSSKDTHKMLDAYFREILRPPIFS